MECTISSSSKPAFDVVKGVNTIYIILENSSNNVQTSSQQMYEPLTVACDWATNRVTD